MIEIFVNNIERSLKDKCYFSALALALVLPDMCGMAEFPEEQLVSKRYIEWYDKYLGSHFRADIAEDDTDTPWLSGEVVYNLRNTYLHQGVPSVNTDKIKTENNQLDNFSLMLGDGTMIQQMTSCINFGNGECIVRNFIIDITFLCNTLCDCALWYYQNNRDKFEFRFSILLQDELKNPKQQEKEGDIIAKVINKKLSDTGSTKRVIEDTDNNVLETMKEGINIIFSDKDMKQRFLEGGFTFTYTKPRHISKEQEKSKIQSAKSSNTMSKRESQIRLFFGRHFKKKIYVDKKEEIIQSVLEAKTRQQVNNNLMKFFRSEEVKVIFQRLYPLIKNMPAK